MTWTERVDAFQRRHTWASFPLAVIYKFTDDQGNYLAAIMTYYAFLAIFPLLLLGSSILGFVLQGDPGLQDKILNSALMQFPVIGDQLNGQEGLRGSATAVIVGSVGALYGALGVANATQHAMNVAWAVPRNKRGNPIVLRLRSLLLLITAGVGIVATTTVSILGSNADALGAELGSGLKVGLSAVSLLINVCVFILLFRLATAHPHSLRRAVPGAVMCAVLWQGLQLVGTAFVGHIVRDADVISGLFAIVLGAIIYIYLGAAMVVFSVEVNVVKAHRLYPRALLTPFTDNVDLTVADRRAYSDYASAQRTKDFETVEVRFEHDGQYASAKKRAKQEGAPHVPEDDNPSVVTDATSGEPHQHF